VGRGSRESTTEAMSRLGTTPYRMRLSGKEIKGQENPERGRKCRGAGAWEHQETKHEPLARSEKNMSRGLGISCRAREKRMSHVKTRIKTKKKGRGRRGPDWEYTWELELNSKPKNLGAIGTERAISKSKNSDARKEKKIGSRELKKRKKQTQPPGRSAEKRRGHGGGCADHRPPTKDGPGWWATSALHTQTL